MRKPDRNMVKLNAKKAVMAVTTMPAVLASVRNIGEDRIRGVGIEVLDLGRRNRCQRQDRLVV